MGGCDCVVDDEGRRVTGDSVQREEAMWSDTQWVSFKDMTPRGAEFFVVVEQLLRIERLSRSDHVAKT
jgi:hypothetical protein